MLIRRERPADAAAVRSVLADAFADPLRPYAVPAEVGLVESLRKDAGWLPALSLVAVDPTDEVLGYVLGTRGRVGDTAAVGLAPLAVHPDRQRSRVGTALMHAVLGAADALDEPFVALLGEPDYYRRFGFRTGTDQGINPPDPDWGDYFQVRTLSAYRRVTGTFRYAAPFDEL